MTRRQARELLRAERRERHARRESVAITPCDTTRSDDPAWHALWSDTDDKEQG